MSLGAKLGHAAYAKTLMSAELGIYKTDCVGEPSNVKNQEHNFMSENQVMLKNKSIT